MKKLFLFILLVLLTLTSLNAQHRSINFEQNKTWENIVKKAQKERKLIFIDCQTFWCGACKIMAKQTFTQDSVADFFNANFVNIMYDMEKDSDGVMLRKRFGINVFPTLLFVDPITQKVIHYVIGSRKAETLIADGKQALDPKNNLANLKKRYVAGERKLEFMIKYLAALSAIYQEDEVNRIVPEYLNKLTQEQLATKAGWKFINEYVNDPLSAPLQQVVNEQKKFYTIAGKEAVKSKLEKSIHTATQQITEWTPKKNSPFNEKRNQELIEYLLKIDSEAAPEGLAKLYTAAFVRKKDFQGLLNQMDEVSKYNLIRGKKEKYYFLQNISTLIQCNDTILIKKGIQRIDSMCTITYDYLYKAKLMNCKVSLQTHIGDHIGAQKSQMEEKKYLAIGKKEKGTPRLAPKY